MTRKIKALGVKMVLSGEGSDEIFGGYLYFHKAPSKEELHKETLRKVGRQIPGPSILKAFSKFSADSLHAICSTSGLQAGVSVLNVNLCFVFWFFPTKIEDCRACKIYACQDDGFVQTTESENISYYRYVTLMELLCLTD